MTAGDRKLPSGAFDQASSAVSRVAVAVAVVVGAFDASVGPLMVLSASSKRSVIFWDGRGRDGRGGGGREWKGR